MRQYDYQCCRNLIADIFNRAVRDLEHKYPMHRREARQFLNSEYAERLASFIDLNIEEARRRLEVQYE